MTDSTQLRVVRLSGGRSRLASPTPDDNRVTHGCINVSPAFYEQVVSPTFARGGVFYVLPDEGSLEEAFPEFAGAGTRKTAGD